MTSFTSSRNPTLPPQKINVVAIYYFVKTTFISDIVSAMVIQRIKKKKYPALFFILEEDEAGGDSEELCFMAPFC